MVVREKISGNNISGTEYTMKVQLGNADCICYPRMCQTVHVCAKLSTYVLNCPGMC